VKKYGSLSGEKKVKTGSLFFFGEQRGRSLGARGSCPFTAEVKNVKA
jgi:hypothetical protein